MKSAARRMALVAILLSFVARGVVIPEIAASKSYREFMTAVNATVKPGDGLYLYGQFNSDPLVFYRGGPIATLGDKNAGALPPRTWYVITTVKSWSREKEKFSEPIVRSEGTGPEGDAPLVLVQARS